MNPNALRNQRGSTLIVAVVVLMLITMTVVSAFRVSKSHTQAVANMQFTEEALAAANWVMEDVISMENVETLVASDGTIPVQPIDINRDGKTDFQVRLVGPSCIRVEPSSNDQEDMLSDSDFPNLGGFSGVTWEVQAEVTDAATGASVTVVQGFRQQVATVPISCN
jgi:hypothetical protein